MKTTGFEVNRASRDYECEHCDDPIETGVIGVRFSRVRYGDWEHVRAHLWCLPDLLQEMYDEEMEEIRAAKGERKKREPKKRGRPSYGHTDSQKDKRASLQTTFHRWVNLLSKFYLEKTTEKAWAQWERIGMTLIGLDAEKELYGEPWPTWKIAQGVLNLMETRDPELFGFLFSDANFTVPRDANKSAVINNLPLFGSYVISGLATVKTDSDVDPGSAKGTPEDNHV